MANQQLIDYVKGQMLAGVSEIEIRKILKDAGWPDAEVEDAVKGAKPAPASSPAENSPAAAASQMSSGSAFSGMGTTAMKSAEPAKVEPKKETISFDALNNSGSMPSMSMSLGGAKSAEKKDMQMEMVSGNKKSMVPWIVAGVAVIGMLVVGYIFYSQNTTLSDQVQTLTASNSALNSQLAALQKGGAEPDTQVLTLTEANKSLTDQLNLFVAPSAAGTSSQAFSLKGTVGTSGTGTKMQYTLTTTNGVLLYVKNSKDVKLDLALKSLVGKSAELSGTHVPLTFEITVVSVNGEKADVTAASSTPSQATSTGSPANPAPPAL